MTITVDSFKKELEKAYNSGKYDESKGFDSLLPVSQVQDQEQGKNYPDEQLPRPVQPKGKGRNQDDQEKGIGEQQ